MNLFLSWLGSVPDFAVPYALAALGLIIAERSGVLSLGAEGLMLVGALAAIGCQLALGVTGVSLLVAMISAAVVSVLFAVMVVWLRINQVIAGLALVFFCQGLTGLLGTVLGWTNQPVTGAAEWLGQNWVVWATPFIFWGVTAWLMRSASGLRLRAVGENPQAADAAGISVNGHRFWAIVLGATLIGLAGAFISLLSTKLWIANMTGGRGWIAIGLVIFARWSPWRALVGALLFGCIEALIPQLAAAGVKLPQYFVLMTPYLVTLLVMIWAATRQQVQEQPGALGDPFVREERK
jgi:simple sugar transport system permease protein